MVKKLLASLFCLISYAHATPLLPTRAAIKDTLKKTTRSCRVERDPRCVTNPDACFCRTVKHYPLRSQSFHSPRSLAGSIGHIHQFDTQKSYVSLSATVEYHSSIYPNKISSALFGNDVAHPPDCDLNLTAEAHCSRTRYLMIQGSDYQGKERSERAWLADYFYLPRDYRSIVCYRPHINAILAQAELYLGLDGLLRGTYLRLLAPFVHTRWDLNMCEKIEEFGSNSHPTGYFATAAIPRALLVDTFESFMKGATPSCLVGDPAVPFSEAIDPTIIFQPLRFARMSRLNRHRNGLADVRAALGFNIAQSEERSIGISINLALPTGPKNDATYLFNPIVGNGNHWEIGGGLNASTILWAGQDGENHVGFSIDGTIMYKLEDFEPRTFELKSLPNSAYMLMTKFGPNPDVDQIPTMNEKVAGLTSSTPDCTTNAPLQQFALEYAPVANLTTLNVSVGGNLQLDLTFMLNFTVSEVSIDIGYNFWLNRGDEISNPASTTQANSEQNGLCDRTQRNTWALKGDARMFGYKIDTPAGATDGEPIALSATQSDQVRGTNATIHNGNNAREENRQVLLGTPASDDINKHIDNPLAAGTAIQPAPMTACVSLVRFPGDAEIVNTSVDPIFLRCEDIDFVEIRGKSHTFFAHLGFNRELDSFVPHIGIGVFIEIGSNNTESTQNLQETSAQQRRERLSLVEVTPSFWGVWLKGGMSF